MGEEVCAVRTGCFGLCSDGPIIVIQPENIMYAKVQPEDVEEIWESHIKRGKPVERLVSKNEKAFFSKQQRIALKNCGRIDPENIDEYIAAGGYAALIKVLNDMEPEDVIDIVKKSGIRGRGGGGFLAGRKWEAAAKQMVPDKIVCCNADEGDPGAFMDRSCLLYTSPSPRD